MRSKKEFAILPTSTKQTDNKLKLKEYIKLNFKGSATAYGREIGESRQTIDYWTKCDYVVKGGKIYKPQYKFSECLIEDEILYVKVREA